MTATVTLVLCAHCTKPLRRPSAAGVGADRHYCARCLCQLAYRRRAVRKEQSK